MTTGPAALLHLRLVPGKSGGRRERLDRSETSPARAMPCDHSTDDVIGKMNAHSKQRLTEGGR